LAVVNFFRWKCIVYERRMRKTGPDLAENLTHDAMLELAGQTYFDRGEDYHRGGHVYDLVEYAGVVVAKVAGTADYRVRLWVEDGDLDYSCTCPLGLDGEFCKHCVAAGLAWLEDNPSEHAPGGPATMDDVKTYLQGQEKDLLVRIVMEQAMEDEGLRDRLLLRASRVGGLNLAAFRRAVDDAVKFDDDYYGPPWEYARGIQNVVEAIAELFEEGFAVEVIELSEYALAKIEGAMNYDFDGNIGDILEDLEGIHLRACKRAKPDPEALAKRLFDWELGGDYDTFFDAVDAYAEVLGEKGLAEYQRLAEEEWADVPALGPARESRPRYYGRRERLADIMQALAFRSGDVEAVVAIKSKDLSSPFAYLEIARLYKEAGDDDKALEWAEEGAWVFPDGGHPELRRFLADEYHDRGRHEEAMALIWKRFEEIPRLHIYQDLKDHADRAGAWERWREKALDFLREDIAKKKQESKSDYLMFTVDNSELVGILLWEGNVEEAWREAKEGGCSDRLWLDLAARREEGHPEDSLIIYQERIEPLVNQTNKKAYADAYELLLRVRELMRRLVRQDEFDEYVELLRLEYKRKRNFMKLLDGME
jgi:uncharacterized Zn finger protein